LVASAIEGELDDALYEGLLRGVTKDPHPWWGCQLDCVEVRHEPSLTEALGVRIAAVMAAEDCLAKLGWNLVKYPSGRSLE
jgi:hypothetical protein